MKYLAASAKVLNNADRFERSLTWILFCQEQNARLWSDPSGWIPGEPMYLHPGWRLDGDGSYARPIYELLEFDQFHNRDRIYFEPRCEECQVYWFGDTPCWSCGKLYPWEFIGQTDKPFLEVSHLAIFNEEYDVSVVQSLRSDHAVHFVQYSLNDRVELSVGMTTSYAQFMEESLPDH